jgi:hypothetical protein
MWRKIRGKIIGWYEGEFELYKNDPNSSVVIIGGDYRRHWTAVVARTLVRFWLEHWKWIVGVAVAISAVVVNAWRASSGH